MTQETILNILAFMKRADLKGEEVPAYNECTRQLNEEYRVLQEVIEKREEPSISQ